MEEVAVVGWAQTEHRRAMERETPQSIIYMVVDEALSSCGLTIHDIDVVIDAGSDFLDGRGISTCLTVDAMGGHFKEESKVAGDGLLAAAYAYMRIASGLFSTALVVAYGKSSESDPASQTMTMCEPFFTRPLGVDGLVAAALQARSYTQRYGVSAEGTAKVAVKNRAAGASNPYAQLKQAVTLEDVLGSRELVSPIKELEAAPVTDGACAVVLAHGDVARAVRVRAAWISGLGHCSDAYSLGSRDRHRATAAARAATTALKMAGISDPLKELDLAEISEFYAYQELMLYEALGLCDEGEGEALLASGETSPGGTTPVNLSGGVLCANPLVATGLVRLADASAQVSGRAEYSPLRGAKKALAHGGGGLAMQTASCVIVEK
ncbi:MAG: thiolase family protein [Candidatus Geothermincolia bacterium]